MCDHSIFMMQTNLIDEIMKRLKIGQNNQLLATTIHGDPTPYKKKIQKLGYSIEQCEITEYSHIFYDSELRSQYAEFLQEVQWATILDALKLESTEPKLAFSFSTFKSIGFVVTGKLSHLNEQKLTYNGYSIKLCPDPTYFRVFFDPTLPGHVIGDFDAIQLNKIFTEMRIESPNPRLKSSFSITMSVGFVDTGKVSSFLEDILRNRGYSIQYCPDPNYYWILKI